MDIKHDIQTSENRLEIKIESLRADLKRDIAELSLKMEVLRADSKRDVAEAKADLIRWVVSVGLLQSTLIIGVLMKVAHLI